MTDIWASNAMAVQKKKWVPKSKVRARIMGEMACIDQKNRRGGVGNAGHEILCSVACAGWVWGVVDVRINDSKRNYCRTVNIKYSTPPHSTMAWHPLHCIGTPPYMVFE